MSAHTVILATNGRIIGVPADTGFMIEAAKSDMEKDKNTPWYVELVVLHPGTQAPSRHYLDGWFETQNEARKCIEEMTI